jgi:hypothetical protein
VVGKDAATDFHRAQAEARAASTTIRYHRSGNQVHFHEDSLGLKVAVPVARWYAMWNALAASTGNDHEETFYDRENGTLLLATVVSSWPVEGLIERDIHLAIEKVSVVNSEAWDNLAAFFNQMLGVK